MVRLEMPRLPKATAAQVLPRALSKTCQSRRCRAARSLQRQHRPASCRVRSGRRRAGAVITVVVCCRTRCVGCDRGRCHDHVWPLSLRTCSNFIGTWNVIINFLFLAINRTNALVAQNPFMVIMGVYRGFRIRTTWTCSPLHISPASLWCCPPHSVTIGLTSTHLSLAWSTAVRLA